jgi:hypothetical protein
MVDLRPVKSQNLKILRWLPIKQAQQGEPLRASSLTRISRPRWHIITTSIP